MLRCGHTIGEANITLKEDVYTEKWKQLLACLAVPLAAGGLSAWLSRKGMKAFGALHKPPLSPPAWLFPVVWTIRFLLMGLAS